MISLTPHWVVGNERIYNQLVAWQRIIETKSDFRFYYYETEYDRVKWDVEPTETWDELVHTRCVQLRERYQDLKLLYSAGRDSHHILRSFIKYNIPVDELILVHFTVNPIRHWEHVNVVLPMAEKYRVYNPKVRITTIDVTEKDFDTFYTDQFSVDVDTTSLLGTYLPSRYPWILNRMADLTNSKAGFVVGLDKPSLFFEDGNAYARVIDKTFEFFHGKDQILDHFYFAPDLPELYVKQCHMLLNYLNKNYPDADDFFINEFTRNTYSQYYDELCLAVGRGPAFDLSLPLQNGKNKFRSGKEAVYQKLEREAKEKNWKSLGRFNDSNDYWSKKMPEAFKEGDAKLGTIGIWGKKYFLRKFSIKNSKQ